MLKSLIEKLGVTYLEVDTASHDKILMLFRDRIEYKPETTEEYLYLGVFYHYCEK